MHTEPGYETVIIAIASEDSIFIQGYAEGLSRSEFQQVARDLIAQKKLSFVVQPQPELNKESVEFVVSTLKDLGVKSNHIAVAKSGT